MKLLTEYTTFEYNSDLVREAKDAGGKLLLTGPLQKANTLNQNGRVYPLDVLQREVKNYQVVKSPLFYLMASFN